MPKVEFFTIGVFGTTQTSFFNALQKHKITHFCDIRQRRGLRGATYKYANATELQKRLGDQGIEYRYAWDLAPTQAVRDVQVKADKKLGVTISEREDLAADFVAAYRSQILSKVDIEAFVDRFPRGSRVVLFCVEANPKACHRSLLAEAIENQIGHPVPDITP